MVYQFLNIKISIWAKTENFEEIEFENEEASKQLIEIWFNESPIKFKMNYNLKDVNYIFSKKISTKIVEYFMILNCVITIDQQDFYCVDGKLYFINKQIRIRNS